MLPSAPAYELWLTGEGTWPFDKRCLIPSHCRVRRGLGLPSWVGCKAPRKGDQFLC
jgi:hypothetical protein